MNEMAIKAIIGSLRKLAILLPFAPDFSKQDVCEAWCENLADLELAEIGIACKKAIATCKTFPAICEFRAMVGKKEATDDDIASECVEKIWECLRMGFEAQIQAHAEMGELAWAIAMKCGSWYDLCYNTNMDSVDFIKKSWKTTALNHIRRVKSGTVDQVPQLEPEFISALCAARNNNQKKIGA